MQTIKIILAESGEQAVLSKDFPLYQESFQNKLLNVLIPSSVLLPGLNSQYIDTDGVVHNDTNSETVYTAVKIGMSYLKRNGSYEVSKNYYMRYLKTLTYNGIEYYLYERKLPQIFTIFAGQGENAPKLVINAVNISNISLVSGNVIGTGLSNLQIDKATWETQITTSGTYKFVYIASQNSWQLNNTNVSLATYGISVTGTPVDNNEIFITYKASPRTLSIITSQMASLDVLESTLLDDDAPVEATELENIYGEINDLYVKYAQNTTDILLLDDRLDVAETNIETNTEDIATLQNRVDWLYDHLAQAEYYVGTLTGSSLPTNSQLTNFVEETVEREPKNADVIIFILEIAGETDRNYKYIYSAGGWSGYEIPPVEAAGNGSLGVVEGTYAVGSTNNTLVNISGGKILDIFIKDNLGSYRNIREYLNTTTTNIANIVNGSTSVGKALSAIADELGNNIVNTYLTQSAGATKDFVRNYALPRTFNDIFFIYRDPYDVNKGTYAGDVPSQTQQFTKTTSAIGDFTICELTMGNILQRKFELSRKNSCQNSFWITANRNCVATFRLTTQVKLAGEDYVDLAVELTSPISITAGSLQRVDITSVFSYLNDTVINFSSLSDMIKQTLEVMTQESTSTTFLVYSSETYPSTFNLNTTSLVIYNTLGKLGEQPVYELTPSGAITSNGVDLVGSDTAQIYNNTECYLKITIPMDTEGYDDYFGENCYIHSITLGGDSIRLATPYNYLYGQPRFSDLKQVIHYFTDPVATYYMMKCFVQIDSGDNITFIVDEDNVSGKLDKSSETNKVYGTDSSGNQTMIGYDTTPTGNIARRDTNGQLSVPLTPTANEHTTSKKYVDDIVKGKSVANYEIETTDWVADSTYSDLDFNYKATITISGVLSTEKPEVTYSPADSVSGNFSNFPNSVVDGIEIWCKETPTSTIIIPLARTVIV